MAPTHVTLVPHTDRERGWYQPVEGFRARLHLGPWQILTLLLST
jgi:hypothetical protein